MSKGSIFMFSDNQEIGALLLQLALIENFEVEPILNHPCQTRVDITKDLLFDAKIASLEARGEE
jgi:hypothetical protein